MRDRPCFLNPILKGIDGSINFNVYSQHGKNPYSGRVNKTFVEHYSAMQQNKNLNKPATQI
jgi:hypothetical protein